MEDILFIDKPKGISSFDVIRILRKKYNIRKMGHAGTLDPEASGLMIIGVNQGTKKLTDFLTLDKEYIIDILLGVKTDSGDLAGEIITKQKVLEVSESKIKSVLKELIGEIEIQVPIYSAVKIAGKPLYKYAREGKDIVPPKRNINIYDLQYIETKKEEDYYILKVLLHCQKGTYARSVAELIGEKLDLPATVKELRRTKIGDFSVENAEKIDKERFDFKKQIRYSEKRCQP